MEGLNPIILTSFGILISILLSLLLASISTLKKDVKALMTKEDCQKLMGSSRETTNQEIENQILHCRMKENKK